MTQHRESSKLLVWGTILGGFSETRLGEMDITQLKIVG